MQHLLTWVYSVRSDISHNSAATLERTYPFLSSRWSKRTTSCTHCQIGTWSVGMPA